MYIPHRGIGRYATQIGLVCDRNSETRLTGPKGTAKHAVLVVPHVARVCFTQRSLSLRVPKPRTSSAVVNYRSRSASPVQATACHVRFKIPEFLCTPGQHLAIVGGHAQLGAWQAGRAVPMQWAPGHAWTCDVELAIEGSTPVEYKVVLISGSTCVWEPGVNRRLECTEGKSLEVVCLWGLPLPLPSSLSLFAAPARQGTLVHCQVVVPHLPAAPAHQLRLVGSAPQLGSWQPQHGLLLEQQQHAGSSMWVGEVDLPTNVSLTAKLVVLGPSGLPQWEAGADRTLLLEPRAASSAAEGSGFIIMCHYGLPGSQVFFRSWLPGASAWVPDASNQLLAHVTVPEFRTRPGQSLLLVGSLPVLGQWNPAAGLPLSWRAGNAWQGSLLMDPGDELEAKVVLSESSGSYVWEPGPNRRISARHLLGTHTCPPAALPAFAAPSPPLAASTARLQGAGSTAAVPQSPGHRVPAEVFLTLAWGVNSMPAMLVPAARPQSLPQPQAPPATPAEAGEQAAKDDHTTAEDQGLLHFLSFLLAQNLSLATAAPSPTSSWDTAPTSAHTLDSKDNILATDGIPAGHAVASHKLVGRRASHVARAHPAVTESPGRLQALTLQASQLRDEVVAMEMRNSMLQSRLHEAQSRMAMAEAELRAELQQQQQRNKEQQRQLEKQELDREQQQRLQQQQEEQHAASIAALEQRMASELEAARQEVESLQARVLELEAEQAATEARLQPTEEELTRLRQEVHQRTLELQELDAGSRTKLAALVEQHRVELAVLQAGLLEVESGAGAHLSTVRAAAAEAAAAAAASAIVQQQRITDLQQQGQALQAEVQCLNKELAAAKEELQVVLQRQQQLAVEAGQLYAAQLAAQRSELQAAAAAQQAALTARFHQQLLDASQKQAQIVTAHERSLAQQQRALQEEAAKFAREASGLRDTISSLQASAVAGAEQLGALETELMAVRGEHSTALAVAQARSEQELCKARMALDAKLMDASQAAGVDKARWQASLAALTAAHDEQVAELQAASVAQLRHVQEQAALQLQQMASAHCEDLAAAEQKLLVYQSELTRQQELLEVQRAEAGSATRSALDAEQQAETLAAHNGQLQTALIIAQQGAQSAEAHLAGLRAEVVAMREQQSQALAQLRSQHALEMSQLELAQSQELIKAQDSFHAKLASVRSALVRMREEHAAEVKRLQEGIAASTAELQQRREAELQLTATIQRHAGQLASLQAEHDRELQMLRQGSRLALEQQTLASSASLQQLQQQLLDVQASADTALTSRLAELQQQHAAEVASLTQASATGEAALQVAMAQVHAATQQQLQALHTSLAEQLAAAHAAASAAQAQLQQQLDAVHAASEESQLDFRSQLQQAEEAKAAQLADLWLLNEQQLAEQRLAFNTALSDAQARAVAAQTQAAQQERRTAAQALRDAERAAAARVTALEEAHSSRILGLQQQLQQAVHQHSATEAALQAKLQEVRSAAADEAERLQAAQLAREAAVQAEIVARTRQHQEQLHTLRKGHAEDVASLIACHRQREEKEAAAMQLRTHQQVAAVQEELQARFKKQQEQHAAVLLAAEERLAVAEQAHATEVEKLHAQYRAEVAQVHTQLGQAKERALKDQGRLEQQLAQALASYAQAATQRDALQGAAAAARSEADLLRSQRQADQDSLRDLTGVLHQRQASVERLQQQLEVAQAAVTEAAAMYETAKDQALAQAESATSTASALKAELGALQQQWLSSQGAMRDVEAELGALQLSSRDALQALQAELQTAQAAQAQAAAAVTALEHDKERLQKLLAAAGDELAALTAQLHSRQDTSKAVEDELAKRMSREQAEASSLAAAAAAQVAALQAELQLLRSSPVQAEGVPEEQQAAAQSAVVGLTEARMHTQLRLLQAAAAADSARAVQQSTQELRLQLGSSQARVAALEEREAQLEEEVEQLKMALGGPWAMGGRGSGWGPRPPPAAASDISTPGVMASHPLAPATTVSPPQTAQQEQEQEGQQQEQQRERQQEQQRGQPGWGLQPGRGLRAAWAALWPGARQRSPSPPLLTLHTDSLPPATAQEAADSPGVPRPAQHMAQESGTPPSSPQPLPLPAPVTLTADVNEPLAAGEGGRAGEQLSSPLPPGELGSPAVANNIVPHSHSHSHSHSHMAVTRKATAGVARARRFVAVSSATLPHTSAPSPSAAAVFAWLEMMSSPSLLLPVTPQHQQLILQQQEQAQKEMVEV